MPTGIKKLITAFALLVSILLCLEPATAANSLKIGYSANAKTFSVTKGKQVVVTLDTTKWSVSKKSGLSQVRVTASQDFAPAGCNVPGNGCGTTQIKFKLNKVGKAYLVAQRLSAGEAIRCVTECEFKVTFKVR